MDNHMNKTDRWTALRTALLTATAIMLVMSAVMGSAWAYFTTYTRAKGGHVLHMGHEEHDDEDFANWNKKLNITVTSDSKPVYLRAKAFCADYDLTLSDQEVSEDGAQAVNKKWVSGGDGWMYYTDLVVPRDDKGNPADVTADTLFVRINNVPKSEMEGIMRGDEFNVIIVYESTEVQYDDKGGPLDWDDVDWTKKVDTKRTTATSSGTRETSDSDSSSGNEGYRYIVNTNTGRFHIPSCREVAKIEEEHKVFSNASRDELAKTYDPCQVCNP